MMLSVREVAEKLSISQSLVYALCTRGLLEHIRIGLGEKGTIRVTTEALERFIDQRKTDSKVPETIIELKHLQLNDKQFIRRRRSS